MKKSPETRLWQKIRPLFPQSASINRIESHSTSIGFPDLEFCIKGCQGTLELKAVRTVGDRVLSRASQLGWNRRRLKAGGKPLMLLWVEDIDNFYLLRGCDVLDIHDHGDPYEYINHSAAHFDWDEMQQHFIKKIKLLSMREGE